MRTVLSILQIQLALEVKKEKITQKNIMKLLNNGTISVCPRFELVQRRARTFLVLISFRCFKMFR